MRIIIYERHGLAKGVLINALGGGHTEWVLRDEWECARSRRCSWRKQGRTGKKQRGEV